MNTPLRRLWLLAAGAILPMRGWAQQEVMEDAENTVEAFFANLRLGVGNILTVLFLLTITWIGTRLLKWVVYWLADRYRPYRLRIWGWYPLSNVGIWVLVIFTIARMIFPEDSSLVLAFLTSSAIVVGVAAQDTIKNLFGGFWVIIERPFQLNDRIDFGGHYGKVEKINLRSTVLRTLDDSVVTVPNATLLTDAVSNANDGALDCMVVVDFWLPHGVDLNKAKGLAREATITSRYLNFDKPVQIRFSDYYDQGPATRLTVKAYVFDKEFEKTFATEVTEKAKKAFATAGLLAES